MCLVGKHPFGERNVRRTNILNDSPDISLTSDNYKYKDPELDDFLLGGYFLLKGDIFYTEIFAFFIRIFLHFLHENFLHFYTKIFAFFTPIMVYFIIEFAVFRLPEVPCFKNHI